MWLCAVACCLLAVVSSTVSEQAESRIVRIDSGPVRGYKDPNEDIFVYYGIPYAKAPSGTDRFKAPLPSPIWIEPLEAVDKGIVCPQYDRFYLIQNKNIQEDCLIANVYVPNTEKKNLPVLVYVHGGAYISGFGDLVTPKKIVSSKEIIVVNFNYRLGAHGFLCLGTRDIPGNAGMKDQVALLRWVKKNIANFGGNLDDVTIAGYSAGSSSVDLLTLSKSTKGLFKRVIPESGANLSPFSVQVDPIKNAKEYGKLLEFDEDDLQALEDFYKSAPYELLQSGNVTFRPDSNLLTTPCVERVHGTERFLEDSPFNILNSGDFNKVPMLHGFASMEGTINVPIFDQMKDLMNTNFAEFISLQIQDLKFTNEEEKVSVAEKIKKFYFKDKPIDEKNILAYVDFVSDTLMTCPTLRSIKLLLKAGNNNIYLYVYSFVDDSTPLVPHTEVRATGHCFQTMAVLDGAAFNVTDESNISEDLKVMKGQMRELWANFAKYGRPESAGVPDWPPVGEDMSPYMDLKKNPQLEKYLLKERCSFWEEIYEKYYNNPIPPSAPLPSPIWFETLEALNTDVICPQMPLDVFGIDTTTKVMQVDCLIANVYVPNIGEKNLPVVVYVHGGGFIIGYGNFIIPKKLVSIKKIIAVTFNYRLGAHGFLCLGTEEAPGNAGIKDQVALLRWVKKNIASFGGNPDDVTIAGASAGSTSVDLLMISAMAKGLFTKVIPESGANLSPYSVQVDPIQNAKEYAKLLKYDGEGDIYNLQDFYLSVSYELFQSGNVLHRASSDFLMAPCVERDIGGERFLEDSPVNILKKAHFETLPMLYGFANMEGLLRIDIFDSWKNKMNSKFSDFLPADLQFKSENEKEAVAEKIKKHYFGDKGIGDETVLDYVNYFSDVFFVCPTLRSIGLQIKAGNNQIYLYEYSYVDDSTPVVPYTNVRGANHCAQSAAILDGVNIISPLDEKNISDDLASMKHIMRELWGSFISTGKPESSKVPAWPPVGADWSPHMALKKNPELRGPLANEQCLIWNEIFDKYYRSPLPPPPPPTRRYEL